MSAHDIKQPYMIYEGPRPTPAAPAEPAAADAVQADGSWDEGEAERGWGAVFGVGLLVAGTLAAGIAIGVWLAPNLRATDAVASVEPPAPVALPVTRPAEARAPAPIEVPPLPAQTTPEQQASIQAGPAPSPSTAPPARVAPRQPIKTAASRSAPAVAGCKANGNRVQMTLCADASIATADRDMRDAFQRALRSTMSPASLRADQDDWLAFREEAARRSPGDLADAYRQRIAELNELGDEPPH